MYFSLLKFYLPETVAYHTAIVVFVDMLSNMVHFAPRWNIMSTRESASFCSNLLLGMLACPERDIILQTS